MALVLLVDDDLNQLEVRAMLLERAGHTVLSASGAAQALELLQGNSPTLVVMDLHIPQTEDGLRLIRFVRQLEAPARIVVLSGWTEDLLQLPEAQMVDRVLPKPVRSASFLKVISKLALWLMFLHPGLDAQTANSIPFEVDAAGEVTAELELSAPGADWGRAGRESVLAAVTVDDGRKQNVMVFAGAERHRYPIFLGSMTPGAHMLKIDRLPDASARGIPLQVHGTKFKTYKASDPDYAVIAHAPVIHARQNTIGKFTDIPLLTYCEKLGDGSLRYSVIFSNEDGGTSTRALMARWGRVTDIEHVYQVWLDKTGHVERTSIQTRDHKDVPFQGKYDGTHPLLVVVTDNNMVSGEAPSAVRYQLAPIVTELSFASREKVMDENSWLYLVAARELEREGKLRTYGSIEGTKISAPENYLHIEMRIANKESRLAVRVRLQDENFFRSSHLGVYDMAIERSGWVRSAIELPPATQPSQIAEIALECIPEAKTEGKGSCRVDAISKLFFLNAKQQPDRNFWAPRIDRGPWVIPAGQMRMVPLR